MAGLTRCARTHRLATGCLVIGIAAALLVGLLASDPWHVDPNDPHPEPTAIAECSNGFSGFGDGDIPVGRDWSHEIHPLGETARIFLCDATGQGTDQVLVFSSARTSPSRPTVSASPRSKRSAPSTSRSRRRRPPAAVSS